MQSGVSTSKASTIATNNSKASKSHYFLYINIHSLQQTSPLYDISILPCQMSSVLNSQEAHDSFILVA